MKLTVVLLLALLAASVLLFRRPGMREMVAEASSAQQWLTGTLLLIGILAAFFLIGVQVFLVQFQNATAPH